MPAYGVSRNGTSCSGNSYNQVITCCSTNNGTIELHNQECDAECCRRFGLPDGSNCPKTGVIAVPWCILPKTDNGTNWEQCYSHNGNNTAPGQAGISGCSPPLSASSATASWSAIMLFSAIAATGVLAVM